MSDLICKWMHMKNNAIINNKTAYKWKLPNVTEWNVDPESFYETYLHLSVDKK